VNAAERTRVLKELVAWAGAGGEGRRSYRPLSSSELCSLKAEELIEIGAHSVTHPALASLSLEDQEIEIKQSKSMIERVIGKPVTSFSYPFGGRKDFTGDTVHLVYEAGFERACANFQGIATNGAAQYSIPRVLVRNWGGVEFASRLEPWDAT
jgi:peptidoglycan/xylan/chitin deacetylase (PgdA/CDA1 family)